MFNVTIKGVRQTIVHFDKIITNLERMPRRERQKMAGEMIQAMDASIKSKKMWTHSGPARLQGSFYLNEPDKDTTHIQSHHPYAKAVDQGVPHGWYQPNNPIWKSRAGRQKQHPPNRPLFFVRDAAQSINPNAIANKLAREIIGK